MRLIFANLDILTLRLLGVGETKRGEKRGYCIKWGDYLEIEVGLFNPL